MSRKHVVPAMDELREALRTGAARDLEASLASSRPRRGWKRRSVAIAAIGLTLGAAGAGAAVLIGVGEPIVDGERGERFKPSAAALAISVTAADGAFPLPWAVASYRNAEGQACAVAGQARGQLLGRLEAGRFRPYEPRTAGPCGIVPATGLFSDSRSFPGPPPRTLIYGRARAGTVAVRLRQQDGQQSVARLGDGGAFLFVLEGGRPQGYALMALDQLP